MNKHIDLYVEADDNKGLDQFVETFDKASQGEQVETVNRVTFDSLETLLKTLTPKRFELLKVLQGYSDGISVRELSRKVLQRPYKNVFEDVGALESIGLIGRTGDNLIYAPYQEIDAHLNLAA